MNTIDGSESLIFFFASVIIIILFFGTWRLVETISERLETRKRRKSIASLYETKMAHIESLLLTYRMMISGRALWAEGINNKVNHLSGWIDQESPLLILSGDLKRILPVQNELIEVLERATKRGRGGVAPAEFRGIVEGHRNNGSVRPAV